MLSEISISMKDPSTRTVKVGGLQAHDPDVVCHKSVDALTDHQNAEMCVHMFNQKPGLEWVLYQYKPPQHQQKNESVYKLLTIIVDLDQSQSNFS